MKKHKAYKYLLWKAYFDKGYSLTNYMKIVIALISFYSYASNINPAYIVIGGIVYLFSCLIIGRVWYHFKLVEVENEVSNIYNPFQREVRAKLKAFSKA